MKRKKSSKVKRGNERMRSQISCSRNFKNKRLSPIGKRSLSNGDKYEYAKNWQSEITHRTQSTIEVSEQKRLRSRAGISHDSGSASSFLVFRWRWGDCVLGFTSRSGHERIHNHDHHVSNWRGNWRARWHHNRPAPNVDSRSKT